MAKLPSVTGEQLLKALVKDGYKVLRQKGSHVVVSKVVGDEELTFPVPVHKGKDIKPGLLNGILAQAKISRERFRYLLTLLTL
ncbi:MAG: type II toxin-antitoxin system HicA family toxin [Nitrospirae bacterium]|nr:type II toxin-antitoxin system HicA family toxin [Nitrospirota bacterium]